MNENDRKYWDNFWDKIENTVTHKDIQYLIDEIKLEYLLSLLQSMPSVPKDIKTIEVGSGSALLSCFLAQYGYETYALDYSKSALNVAKNNYMLINKDRRFILGDVRRLPFKNDSFDVVISTGLLEHFRDPQIVVDEMVRVFKKGGLFFSDIVPKKFRLITSLAFVDKLVSWMRGKKLEHYYEKKLNKRDIEQLLLSSGLHKINVFAGEFSLPKNYFHQEEFQLKKSIKSKYYTN
jgi:ubiquinone/menaquinone biosynthesis C-methylase UbiE